MPIHAPLAQLAEQGPFKPKVTGSIPVRRIRLKDDPAERRDLCFDITRYHRHYMVFGYFFLASFHRVNPCKKCIPHLFGA